MDIETKKMYKKTVKELQQVAYDLSSENRKFSSENGELYAENAALRRQVAQLREAGDKLYHYLRNLWGIEIDPTGKVDELFEEWKFALSDADDTPEGGDAEGE